MYYRSLEAALRKSYYGQGQFISYYPGYEVVELDGRYAIPRVLSSEEVANIPISQVADFRSDKEKLIMIFHPSIAHMLQDSFPMLAAYSELHPDHQILLLSFTDDRMKIGGRENAFGTDLLHVSVDFLQSRGVEVFIIPPGTKLLTNKAHIMGTTNQLVLKSQNVMSAVDKALEEISPGDPEASAKLYISRSRSLVRDYEFPEDDVNLILTDDRIFNEEALEKVFEEMGFEIVYAEEFESFLDQLAKMRTAKVIAGVSGAGLSNFMLTSEKVANRLLVEISTPIVIQSISNPGDSEDSKFNHQADVTFHTPYWELANVLEGATYISHSGVANRNGAAVAHEIRQSPLFEFLKNY